MTINEAINHCSQRAKENNVWGDEHKQLAEWLIELKKLRIKEIPYTLTNHNLSYDNDLIGKCKCGFCCVSKYDTYCKSCGQLIEWEE